MKSAWTQARRKRQSDQIRKWQPWLCSSGSKSAKGKFKSKMNAYKYGANSYPVIKEVVHLREHLKKQSKYLNQLYLLHLENNSQYHNTK